MSVTNPFTTEGITVIRPEESKLPNFWENAVNALCEVKLLAGGNLIGRYGQCGNIAVVSFLEKKIRKVKNPIKIISWTAQYPIIASIHDNDQLQVINVQSGTVELYDTGNLYTPNAPQENLNAEGYSSIMDAIQAPSAILNFPLKSSQVILIDAERILAVSNMGVYVWWRPLLKSPPSGASFPLNHGLSSIVDEFCSILDYDETCKSVSGAVRILVGNEEAFQIWRISGFSYSDVKQEINTTLEFEGRIRHKTQQFLGVFTNGSTIVTYTTHEIAFWKAVNVTSGSQPIAVYSIPNGLSLQHAHLDDLFALVADSNGVITLFDASTGEKLHSLNVSIELEPSLASTIPKVTSIQRYGRWILLGLNDRLRIYDINKSNCKAPMLEYTHNYGTSAVKSSTVFHGVLVDRHQIVAASSPASPASMETPDIIVWEPTLVGFRLNQPYVPSTPAPTQQRSFTMTKQAPSVPLTYSHTEIHNLFNTHARLNALINSVVSKDIELVIDFIAALSKIFAVISLLGESNGFIIPICLVQQLQGSLGQLTVALDGLNTKGILPRNLESHTVRRPLVVLLNNVYRRLSTVQHFIAAEYAKWVAQGIENQALQKSVKSFKYKLRHSFINDDLARQTWVGKFNEKDLAEAPEFLQLLESTLQCELANDVKYLLDIVDPSSTGFVNAFYFSSFLGNFGPFQDVITNGRTVWSQPWFHSYTTVKETDHLLKPELDATFLVHFPKIVPSRFAIAFKAQNAIAHVLVAAKNVTLVNKPPQRVYIIQETGGASRYFETWADILENHKALFSKPCTNNFRFEGFYAGDINSDETAVLLTGQPVGSFLLRFSSIGQFATSFVEPSLKVNHVIIKYDGKSYAMTGDDAAYFPSLKQMLQYYINNKIFTKNIKNVLEQSILNEKQEEDKKYATMDKLLADQVKSASTIVDNATQSQAKVFQQYEATLQQLGASKIAPPQFQPKSAEDIEREVLEAVDPFEKLESHLDKDVLMALHQKALATINAASSLRSLFEKSANYINSVNLSKNVRDSSLIMEEVMPAIGISLQTAKTWINTHSSDSNILPPKIDSSSIADDKLKKLRDITGVVFQKVIGSIHFVKFMLEKGGKYEDVTLDAQHTEKLSDMLTRMTQAMSLAQPPKSDSSGAASPQPTVRASLPPGSTAPSQPASNPRGSLPVAPAKQASPATGRRPLPASPTSNSNSTPAQPIPAPAPQSPTTTKVSTSPQAKPALPPRDQKAQVRASWGSDLETLVTDLRTRKSVKQAVEPVKATSADNTPEQATQQEAQPESPPQQVEEPPKAVEATPEPTPQEAQPDPQPEPAPQETQAQPVPQESQIVEAAPEPVEPATPEPTQETQSEPSPAEPTQVQEEPAKVEPTTQETQQDPQPEPAPQEQQPQQAEEPMANAGELSDNTTQSLSRSNSNEPSITASTVNITDPAEMRKQLIADLFDTEKEYREDLRTLLEVFANPIKARKVIPDDSYFEIFGKEIEPMLQLNSQILLQWDNKPPAADPVVYGVAIFNKIAQFLKMYTAYFANQQKSMQKLQELRSNEEFNNVLVHCEADPRAKEVPLLGYLIKPVQRLCIYPVLLSEILKYTPEDNKTTIMLITETKKKLEAIFEQSGEATRESENLQKVYDIQRSLDRKLNLVHVARKFIREGLLTLNGELLQAFLLSDLILFVRAVPEGLEFKDLAMLEESRLVTVADSESLKHAFQLEHSDNKKVWTIVCASNEELESWLKEIKTLKKEIQKRQYDQKYGNRVGNDKPDNPIPQGSSSFLMNPLERKLRGVTVKSFFHKDKENKDKEKEPSPKARASSLLKRVSTTFKGSEQAELTSEQKRIQEELRRQQEELKRQQDELKKMQDEIQKEKTLQKSSSNESASSAVATPAPAEAAQSTPTEDPQAKQEQEEKQRQEEEEQKAQELQKQKEEEEKRKAEVEAEKQKEKELQNLQRNLAAEFDYFVKTFQSKPKPEAVPEPVYQPMSQADHKKFLEDLQKDLSDLDTLSSELDDLLKFDDQFS